MCHKKLKIILFGLSYMLFNSVKAQDLTYDFPPSRNYRIPKSEISVLKNRYDSIVKNYKFLPRREFDFVSESFKEMKEEIEQLDSTKVLMERDLITVYLINLKNKIIAANKDIVHYDFNIYTERSIEPNAYNMGAHIIVVELDIISKLRTEEELTYVLCHEISHDVLSHVEKGIKKLAEIINDKELKEKIREINRQTYGSYRKANKVINSVVSKYMVHSRENELEADSLGFILYKKLSLSQNHCVNTLAFLDSIDAPPYKLPINYNRHFSSEGYTLNQSLFIDEDYTDLGGNIDNVMFIPDSLKTHPNSLERAGKIKKMMDNKSTVKTNNSSFEKIRELAKFEETEYLLNNDEYGLALYNCLHLSNNYPDNIYLKKSILYCLISLYEASLKHTYSSMTDLPDKHYLGEYNKFLIFINNLNSTMLNSMVTKYKETINFGSYTGDYAQFISIYMRKVMDSSLNEKELLKNYEEQFKNNFYSTVLKEKFKINKKNKK